MTSTAEQPLDDSRWWAALAFQDRLTHGWPGAAKLTDDDVTRGEIRLRLMREGKLVPGVQIPLSRWEAMGLSEADMITLLGEPVESLRARIPARPAFLDVIATAWRRYGDEGPAPAHNRGHSHDHGHDHGHENCTHHTEEELAANAVFLDWVRPLLRWAHDELAGRVDALVAMSGASNSVPVTHPLLAPPVDRVLQMINRVLVLELNAARVEGRLTGTTPQERFASFAELISTPDSGLAVLAEYPVLARELVGLLTSWLEVRTEFVQRLLADLPLLRDTFGLDGQHLGDLVSVEFGAGDTHNGGRAVAIVTLPNGRVVYKPREMGVEIHFNQLLHWVNERGLRHSLRGAAVLDRGDYGWVEFVPAQACADTGELSRFYWRQGAFLALFHALRTTDLHLENLIASGEHPAFVDLESLFYAAPKAAESTPDLAATIMAESVLSVGLLPERIIEIDETGMHDLEISGLAGGAGPDQLTPSPVVWFAGPATDEMKVAKERRPILDTANRATLDGEHVDPWDYHAYLLDGFTCGYQLLLDHRDELLAADGPVTAFAGDVVRPILRHTSFYDGILMESWHPDMLRDSLDRDYLLETLNIDHSGIPGFDNVVASEVAQLGQRDIPAFSTRAGSRDLFDHRGLVLADFRQRTGVESVVDRVSRFSEDDLDQQLWCIKASLSGLQVGERGHVHHVARDLPDAEITSADALAAAVAIGDRLLATALRADGSAAPQWLSLNLIGERYWRVGLTELGLYSGVGGIALFLAELGEATGDSRYRQAAQGVADVVVEHVDTRTRQTGDLGMVAIGAYEDLGGMLYLCARLGELWDSEHLLDMAERLVPVVTATMAGDRFLDIISGTAGAALAAMALHRVRPTESTMDSLRVAGEVLRAKAEPQEQGVGWPSEMSTHRPLAGFSHGASGYAYTLARIAGVTGDERLLDLVGAALRFERHLFDAATGHWPDLRTINIDGSPMNAWCHGAAGVGLARAAMLGMPALVAQHDLIREDLLFAADRVRRDLVRDDLYTGIGNDSICHGDLGLVETLRAAARVLRDPELDRVAGRCAASIARRALDDEVRTGVPFAVPTPGLMAGTAGIGYGLLREALGDRVPNLLLAGGAVAEADRG